MNDDIDDGSDKPTGFVSPDGELEVRDSIDGTGQPFHGYHETELGQHQRWMRQAPDLFEKYMTAVAHRDALLEKLAAQVGNASVSATSGIAGTMSPAQKESNNSPLPSPPPEVK